MWNNETSKPWHPVDEITEWALYQLLFPDMPADRQFKCQARKLWFEVGPAAVRGLWYANKMREGLYVWRASVLNWSV